MMVFNLLRPNLPQAPHLWPLDLGSRYIKPHQMRGHLHMRMGMGMEEEEGPTLLVTRMAQSLLPYRFGRHQTQPIHLFL